MFCPTCGKCPQCCTKSACRGQTSKLLENSAKSRGRSEGSSNPPRGLPPPLSDPAPTHKVPYSHKPVCQSPQEQLPAGGITSACRQKRSGKGSKSKIPRVFQPTISNPETQQQMEANTGPKQTKPFPQSGKVQDGDTGNHQNIPPSRGVGHLSRLQRCLLSHTNTRTIQEIPTSSCSGPESLEKIIPLPRTLHPHLQWWLDEDNVLQGQPLHPVKHALQIFTDASKEGWGAHLNELTARGSWSVPESKLHINHLELKAVFLTLKEFQDLCRQNSPSSNRQYYSRCLHKQGRRHEIGPAVCPTLENLDLVFPATSNSKSPTHPRPSKRDSQQTIQTGSGHPNRMVPPSGGFSTDLQPMAPVSNRSICHEVQPQVTSVCLSNTGLPGCSSGCTYSAMGRSGCICLPTACHIGQSGGEATGLPVQETHSDCPRVAQHALVLGLSGHVQSGPSQPAQPAQAAHTALQSDPSQKSDKSKSPCLAPRATKIKEQGFSEAVAARIEAPQRRSTRSVYEAKWAIFTKWCITNQVDFRSPPVKSVADFLMYLFEDKKLQPSTIDGYRSAIADKLGNPTLNISKDDNLTRLLESFHRDRPKGRRGISSWNLSLVLHQLTKAPF